MISEAIQAAMLADAQAYPALYKDLAYFETLYYRIPSANADGWVWFRASGDLQLAHNRERYAALLDDLNRASKDGRLYFDPRPASPSWRQNLLGFKSEYGISV